MAKVKYRVDSVKVGTTDARRNFEGFLNRLAEEGWELVRFVGQPDSTVLVVHRRVKKWWQG